MESDVKPNNLAFGLRSSVFGLWSLVSGLWSQSSSAVKSSTNDDRQQLQSSTVNDRRLRFKSSVYQRRPSVFRHLRFGGPSTDVRRLPTTTVNQDYKSVFFPAGLQKVPILHYRTTVILVDPNKSLPIRTRLQRSQLSSLTPLVYLPLSPVYLTIFASNP